MRRLTRVLLAVILLATSGCARMINFQSAERRDQGYTLVLTGIEGAHIAHAGFVGGLKSGGVPSEIEVVDWTTGSPALMLVTFAKLLVSFVSIVGVVVNNVHANCFILSSVH